MGGSGGSGIRFVEVQQLPATGENGVIYLVPNGDNTFTEWVWLEDEERFEKLGYDVDLSDYYTKTQVDTALAAKQNTLTFDNTPTENSTNPVTSGGIYTALQNVQPDLSNYYTKDEIDDGNITISAALNELHDEKQDKLTFDSTPTSGSSNPVTSGGVYNALQNVQPDLSDYYTKTQVDTALAAKQNTLTFDTAPTENSENPVTSGGIYTALQNVQPDLSNYYTKDEIDEGNRVVSMGLNRLDSGKADKSDTYTKTEVDALLQGVEPDMSNYYSKSEVDSLLQAVYDRIDELPQYSYTVELVNVGTPTEIIKLSEDGTHDGTLTPGATYRIDVSRYLSSGQYVSDPLNCGDFEIELTDYQGNEVTVENCRFTANGTAAEIDYTLVIAIGSKTFTYPNILGTN
jgi:hypothetical protein